MTFGKSIRIYLADGSPSGLRHVEIANWSGQAVACPRSRFSELSNWEETKRPGVYFLFEKHSTDDKNKAYVGESEDVYERLNTHDRKKEFWNELVVFTSKDENLTKAHVKYLESKLVSLSIQADRYILENGNTPPKSSLPRAERDAMEEFIHNIRMLLGTLGHKILEPLSTATNEDEVSVEQAGTLLGHTFDFSVNKFSAKGQQSDEGFILLKGSTAAIKTTQSIPGQVKSIREKLIAEGHLEEKENHLLLTKDTLISSSSYAAALIAGTSRSGPQSWKDKSGRTMKALEDSLIDKT